LRDEAIPQVEWEAFVEAAEGSDEVIFEGADRAFGGVATMGARGNQFESDILVVHVFFEHGRALVVKALKIGMAAGKL
jgi:hypothetical protein